MVQQVEPSQYNALHAFFNAMGGDYWIWLDSNETKWNFSNIEVGPCEWTGNLSSLALSRHFGGL